MRGGAAVRIARPELLGGEPELLAEVLTGMLKPAAEERMTAAEALRAGAELWRRTAEGRAEEAAAAGALEREVAELRRRNRVLEKSVEALNCSGIDTSLHSVQEDPEPFGSQESPPSQRCAVPVLAFSPPPSGVLDGVSVTRADAMVL